ncbi:MAG: zinc ribbon domain-containing protein [Pyrinomonadaceae bacterium]|nr:zinc ribbon domain-containing protein [Pyrinomonadaceae bacterium]
MYCPTCGQQQISDQTRFCSRCGFLLSDIAEVVANKGISPYKTPGRVIKKDYPRKSGIKKGVMLMLIGCFLIGPIVSILFPFTHLPVFVVPITFVTGFMVGVLRIIYALMFEDTEFAHYLPESNGTQQNVLNNPAGQKSLPMEQSIPTSVYVPPSQGSWMTTNDVAAPPSVTEGTTKLLEKDK